MSAIDYSSNKVILTTRNGDVYEADRVLVTVSIGVLKSNMIKFTPDLNEERKQALNDITFHPGIKVALTFSEKFYPDAVACKVKSGEKVYYDIAFKKDSQTKVLGFLCTGDVTQKYYDLNSDEEITVNDWFNFIPQTIVNSLNTRGWSCAFRQDGFGDYQLHASGFIRRHIQPAACLPIPISYPTQE